MILLGKTSVPPVTRTRHGTPVPGSRVRAPRRRRFQCHFSAVPGPVGIVAQRRTTEFNASVLSGPRRHQWQREGESMDWRRALTVLAGAVSCALATGTM